MKTICYELKKIMALFLLAAVSAISAQTFAAEQSDVKTVRVTVDDSGLFFTLDKEGNPVSGYAYEYIETLAAYSGWKIEYIPCPDFSKCYQMLLDGDIDIFYDVSYSPERAKQILFPDVPMGSEEYYLYCLPSNSKIHVMDYSSYNGMRVGITKGTLQVNDLQKWAKSKGVTFELVEFNSILEKEAALRKGLIDLNLEISMLARKDFSPLEKISSSDYYLAVNKYRPDLLEDINKAVSTISSIDGRYLKHLEEQFFSGTLVSKSLTADEARWISEHSIVNVGFLKKYKPFSFIGSDGEVSGIVKDMIPVLLQNINLDAAVKINYIGYDTSEQMFLALSDGSIDCAFPVCGNMNYALGKGALFSSKIISTTVDLVYNANKTDNVLDIIAINSSSQLQNFYSETVFADKKKLYYGSVEQCLDAIASGVADGTVINGMYTSALLRNQNYNSLKSSRLSDTVDYSFAVKNGNASLLSLIDRSIANTEESTATTFSYKYNGEEKESISSVEFFKEHPEYIVIAIFIILIFILLFILYTKRKDSKQADVMRKEQIAKMAGGLSAYILNPATRKFQTIHQNKYLEANYATSDDFIPSVAKYVENDVYEADREIARNGINITTMLANLEKEDEFKIRYRDISTGRPRWYEMRAVKLSDSEILYGFTDMDDEIVKQLLFNKMRDSYFGLIYINLDANEAQIIKTAHGKITGNVGDVVPYTEMLKNIAAESEGEEAEFINRISNIKYLKSCFRTEDTCYHVYKSKFFGAGKWINVTGQVLARQENGSPSTFSLGFSLLDEDSCKKEEDRYKLAESMSVIGGLANEYTALYHVNLDTDEYVAYYRSKIVQEIIDKYGEKPKFTEFHQKFSESKLIHEEDRAVIKKLYPSPAAVKEKLKDKKRIEVLVRCDYEGEFLWTEASIVKCEGVNAEAHNVIVGFIEKDWEVKERTNQIQETEKANRLIENIVSKYNLSYNVNLSDDSFEILSMDEEILMGDEKQFSTFSEVIEFFFNDVIHPFDSEYMKKELNYSVIREKSKKPYTIEYRSFVDGVTNWNEMNVTRISEDNVVISFNLNDIELTKRHLEEKKFDEYLALFVADLDTAMLKSIKAPPVFKTAEPGEAIPYEAAMRIYASLNIGPVKDFFTELSDIEQLKKQFAANDKLTYSYKSPKSGVNSWVDITSYVIMRHEDGTPALVTFGFSLSDVLATERQEVQEKLKEAYGQVNEARDIAEKANKSKTDFLFNMSHDIRTPMNAITGFTNMAKKYISDSERVEDYLNKIDTSGKQLLTLINQVLEMSRIESGKLEVTETPVSVQKEYNSMVVMLEEQAKVNGLKFKHKLSNVKHDQVFADTARMNSITINIAGNAMKYTPAGGTVDFSLKEIAPRKKGYATFVFTVKDTGIGMSKEFLKKLFEPFTREKNSTVSKIQGTGLGLAIVKSLVDVLGGTIEVESEVGKGTKFDITVDFKIDKEDKLHKENKSKGSKISFKGKKILLAEDNDFNMEIAIDLLKEEGIIVDAAKDGAEAVQFMKDKGPDYYDYILMDIQMPVMDGYEATKEIRKMYPDSKIPIVALSANAFNEDREKSLELGMNAHVTKPIDINELFETLGRLS